MSPHLKTTLFKQKHPSWMLFVVLGLAAIAFLVFVIDGRPFLTFLGRFKESSPATSLPLFTCAPEPQEEFGLKPDPDQAELDAALLDGATRGLSKKHKEFKSQGDNALKQQLKNLAKTRKKYLVNAMRHNPDEALFSLLTSAERDTLLLSTSNCVEDVVTLEGTLEVVHADFFEDEVSTTRYTLITKDGERIVLHPARGTKDSLESGTQVRVRGFRIDNDLLFDGSVSLSQPFIEGSGIDVVSQPGNPPVLGDQKTVVLLVDFADTATPSVTPAQTQDAVFMKTHNYYVETSYNKVSLSGNVFGWYELSINQTCNNTAVRTAAIAAADPDVFFPDYSRLIIIAPFGPSCGWAGVAFIGKGFASTADGSVLMSQAWVHSSYVDLPVIGHELGHGFGNHHARFLYCGEVAIAESGCTIQEYGDYADIMGYSNKKGHFNAPHKEYVGWFAASNIQTVTANGTYTIEPFETATAGLKALKIQRAPFDYLYVEYRQAIGFDATIASSYPDVTKGALLHAGVQSYPYLIDATPSSPSSKFVATLKPGATFTDPKTGTAVTVTSASPSGLTVDITLGETDFEGPTASIISPSQGSTVSGVVTVSANAADPSGVERVEFHSSRGLIDTDLTDPYSVSWDTNFAPNETAWLYARAYDTLGNFESSPAIWVTVANSDSEPPSVTLTSPLNGSEVVNPVTVSGSASDNVGVWKVEVYIDSKRFAFFDTSPYEFRTSYALGPHTVSAKAYDFVGNTTNTPLVSFTVVLDSDADGFTDATEQYLGTDPLKACPVTATANDEPTDPWPPDFNDNRIVEIDDVFAVSSRFGAKEGDANYTKRAELASQNGVIGIDDVFAVSSRFGKSCTP